MDDVAEIGLEELWACASAEALQRATDLARRVLKAPAAMVSSFDGNKQLIRCTSGFERPTAPLGDLVICRTVVDTGRPHIMPDVARSQGEVIGPSGLPVAAYIGVPVRLSSKRDIGTICAIDTVPHHWTAEDLDLLLEFAAFLRSQIELKLEGLQRERAEATLGAMQARLLAVADHIPGLVFERRKVDAMRSHYTFFGSTKTSLPAVRQLMQDGGSGPLGFIHREDRDLVRTAMLRSNLEETDLDLTFRVKDFDGSMRWLRSQSIVRRDADGAVLWDGLCFDITDLMAAREGAESARAAKGALIADVDRELRAPLGAIVGLTDFLKAEREPGLIVTHARNIRAAADSMLAVVDHLTTEAGGDAPTPVAVAAAAEPTPPADHAAAPVRVLLADDLDLNRKLIADMLGLEGYVVDCVTDGAEAVKAVSQRPYDLVLMDMIMPGMDGIAATRAIRALPGPAAKVPIVALTANSFNEQLDGCLKAGMDATLTKPMSMDALTAAVSTWTRRRNKAA